MHSADLLQLTPQSNQVEPEVTVTYNRALNGQLGVMVRTNLADQPGRWDLTAQVLLDGVRAALEQALKDKMQAEQDQRVEIPAILLPTDFKH